MIDLESIQHKLSSDYSLNMYFSRCFPFIDGPSFFRTDPYKMSIFQRSVTCSFFFRNCTHILTRTQGKKFEDMFLIKIASKGTSSTEQKNRITQITSCYRISGPYRKLI